METRWTDMTKRMAVVVGALLVLLLIYLARSTLPVLLISAVVAYALFPMVSFLHRRLRFPHTLATVTIYLLLLIALISIPVFVGPLVVREVRDLQLNPTELFFQARQWLRSTLEPWRALELFGTTVDLASLIDPVLEVLGEEGTMPNLPPADKWLPGLAGLVSGVATTVTSAAIAFFLTLIYSFYLVKDSHTWVQRFDQLIPEVYRAELQQLRFRMATIWRSFFRGQLLLCLVIAIMTWVALTAMGIPGAIPLALLAGVLEVVPNFGPLLAEIPAVVVALLQGSSTIPWPRGWLALLVFGVYIGIQQIENNVLVPRIIGGSVDLPPLVVLIGVVVGATNFGLIGAFMASPVLASLKVLTFYVYNKIVDRPPFEEEKEQPGKGAKRGEGEEGKEEEGDRPAGNAEDASGTTDAPLPAAPDPDPDPDGLSLTRCE